MVERPEISQVLSQIRAMQSQMQTGVHGAGQDVSRTGHISASQFARPVDEPGFGELFTRAIDTVNDAQQKSSQLSEAYQLGTQGVTLTQVMVAAEKSGVAFQAMSQVRNRLVEAYKEVMSMPV